MALYNTLKKLLAKKLNSQLRYGTWTWDLQIQVQHPNLWVSQPQSFLLIRGMGMLYAQYVTKRPDLGEVSVREQC